MKGLSSRLIIVDLTDRSINAREYDEAIARQYLCGNAMATYYVFHEAKKDVDPFCPGVAGAA